MMSWDCIPFFGPGDACWIKEKVDSDVYLNVVKDYVLKSHKWYRMNPATFIFRQDNIRVHTARKVMEYFGNKNITLFPWLANSPDLKHNRARVGVHETRAGSVRTGAKEQE